MGAMIGDLTDLMLLLLSFLLSVKKNRERKKILIFDLGLQ